MARDPKVNRHLARALHARFVTSKGDSVEALAQRSGIPADTLYDLCENRADLKARQLPLIARNDPELFALLSGAADAGVVVSRAAAAPSGDLPTLALDLGAESGMVLAAIAAAYADRKIEQLELHHIEALLGRLNAKAEELRAKAREGAQ